MSDELEAAYDVVVIGGGAAGLNAALMLGRSRRSVVVIDSGEPRNAPAEGVHGLLGREGIAPAELLRKGREEVRSYGGHVVAGKVRTASEGFTVILEDGRIVRARRLLVATGAADRLPKLDGVAEQWGKGVVHCPYCHGWEVRDRAIGVLGLNPMSAHQALLFSQLSDDVVYFAHVSPPTTEQAQQLAARGVGVVDGEVTGLQLDSGKIGGVRLTDGQVVRREAVAVAAPVIARVDFLAELGLKTVPHPSGLAEHVTADATGRTDVPGVWAAGNVVEPMAQVGAAAAAGALAGAAINMDLIHEEIGAANA